MTERRKPDLSKSSPLPADFLKMVAEVFNANFDTGLKGLKKLTSSKAAFSASGAMYASEIVLSVSLMIEGQLAATTVYASSDFDPKASSPTVEDLINAGVDAIGSVFAEILKPGKLEQVASESLSALENVPFDWAGVDIEKRRIFLKIDKSNPNLEQMADDWLAKHDPNHKKREALEQVETEELFFTGPKSKMKH